MKRFLIAAVLATSAASAFIPLASAATNIGVAVNVGQPGFYGQLDINNYPQPQLIYQQPMVIYRGGILRDPIYLRVPPGHAKNWSKHCRQYNACGERVYFVQDGWYNREYVPQFQQRERERRNGINDHRGDDHREIRSNNGVNNRGNDGRSYEGRNDNRNDYDYGDHGSHRKDH